jgi:hypothetical protein
MQHWSLHFVLPLGIRRVAAHVYEDAFGYEPGDLGPCSSCQQPFQLREDFLDRPSLEATAEAWGILEEA